MQRGAAQNHQLVTSISRVTGTNGLWRAQMKETVAVDVKTRLLDIVDEIGGIDATLDLLATVGVQIAA